MASHKARVAVLGAGPAGCIAARQLGLAGLDVVLVDAATPYLGHEIESFPPSGAPLAEDIGILPVICAVSDGPAEQMQMHWRAAPETRVFQGDGPLLLRRTELHRAMMSEAVTVARLLRTRARKVDSIECGVQVTTDAGEIICDMVIDARGRHAVKRPASDLVALPFSLRLGGPAHMMWLEALPDGWLWASRLDGDAVQGVLFQQARYLAGLTGPARLAYAQRCFGSSDAFAAGGALQVGTPSAAGLSAVKDPIISERHILVGDAALARDPIASHGLIHALRSGVQAAIAVQTILDPSGDTHAALAFLRHKHKSAVAMARQATARAYTDQSRFGGALWSRTLPSEDRPSAPSIGAGPVALAQPLTRAPVLEGDGICWAPALVLPETDEFFTGYGPVSALDVASACRPSAPLQDVAARLGRLHAMPLVFDVLEHLTLGGAFAQVSEPV